jgi:hypothetical protein
VLPLTVPADPEPPVVVPDPLLPVLSELFPLGEPLGVPAGDELAADDGLESGDGDGFCWPADWLAFGLAVLPAELAHGPGEAGPVAVTLAEAEFDAAVAEVPVPVGGGVVPGSPLGVVVVGLGVPLGLPLSLGVPGELAGGDVGCVPDWLG